MSYSIIHYLRLLLVRRRLDPSYIAKPLPDKEHPTNQPEYEEFDSLQSHLLCHSDCEGFYVPIDFSDVLFDEEEKISGGDIVGSSIRLLAELREIAPALGIRLEKDGSVTDAEFERIDQRSSYQDPLYAEFTAWTILFENARLSVEHGRLMRFA